MVRIANRWVSDVCPYPQDCPSTGVLRPDIKKPRIARFCCERMPILFPQSLGQRQAGKIFGGEPSVRLDAEALEHGHQLARVLRRMPGRALEEHVYRLH